jgi:CubicO group peptidase (beta-lactamase class C family)
MERLPDGFPHESLADPPKVGVDAAALLRAVDVFEAQHRDGAFPGGQLAVRRYGHLIVDTAIGLARGARPDEGAEPMPAAIRTRFPCFSAGKAVLAIVCALLEERGLLDVTQPVARYFPAFTGGPRAEEKGRITVLDVLTHRGGILMRDLCARPHDWIDEARVRQAMSEAEPTLKRGRLAYHPLEYGWLLAEVVRGAGGDALSDVLAREIAGPCGLPGLRYGLGEDDASRVGRTYWLGKPGMLLAGLDVAALFDEIGAKPELLRAVVPGGGLVADAGTLAAFYAMLVAGGVSRHGRRVLEADTVRRWTTRHVLGWDRTNRAPIALGRGFFLGSPWPSPYGLYGTSAAFGHAGAFCVVGFGDHATGLAVAVVTNANRSPLDLVARMAPIGQALRDACR